MIKSVTITNHLNQSLTMELRFPEKSGFLIRNIEGLGPPKANINLTEISNIDGAIFNSARVNSRNLVFNLVLDDSLMDIETVRLNSYKYFPIKKRIKIEVETDTRNAYIYGNVESNEPDIFSERESVNISIMCSSSYFQENQDTITEFGSLSPVFEFPFSNESTSAKLLNFGDISLITEKNIYYSGDADTGVIVIINATGSANNVSMTKVQTSETIELDSAIITDITGSDISSGDKIILSTVVGDKFAVLIRGGVEYNILNAIGKYPSWFKLEHGDNLFSYAADTGVLNLQFTVLNKTIYEGL